MGGYLIILFGWVAYADVFHELDGDGGKVMGVAFTIAPIGAVLVGLALAMLFGHRRRAGPGTIETK